LFEFSSLVAKWRPRLPMAFSAAGDEIIEWSALSLIRTECDSIK
jgi:hypothetical protein